MRCGKKTAFSPYPLEDVAAALTKTLFTVEVTDDGAPVGIARIVGDDRMVFFIKDVVVDPAYQGHGIGRLLMESVLQYIDGRACGNAYVGLMATPGTEGFYERLGFVKRPSPGLGHGRGRVVHHSGKAL